MKINRRPAKDVSSEDAEVEPNKKVEELEDYTKIPTMKMNPT